MLLKWPAVYEFLKKKDRKKPREYQTVKEFESETTKESSWVTEISILPSNPNEHMKYYHSTPKSITIAGLEIIRIPIPPTW